jgi:putative transposase
MNQRERERVIAVERFRNGEKPATICATLGRSRAWLYKWVGRAKDGGEEWFKAQSRCPSRTRRTVPEVEDRVEAIRLSLYNRGLSCGPQAILWEMEDQALSPRPSERTVARILSRRSLTHQRTGAYEPKGKVYPAWPASAPGDVHQADFVGPRYLKGPVRFYSLNCMDAASRRCAIHPITGRASELVINVVWESWWKLGLPGILQLDNELAFFGSRRHPHGMGALIRLCLLHGVEPCFIPIREPWRNGIIERFNRTWVHDFFRRTEMDGWESLTRESNSFERRWNAEHRHSSLRGRTPLQFLADHGTALEYPPQRDLPKLPLPKPKTGRYHFIRFIRSNRRLDIFGESFRMPIEATYEYVRATVDVSRQKLRVYLGDELLHAFDYRLR